MSESKSDLIEITWSKTEKDNPNRLWKVTTTCYLDKYQAESIILSFIEDGDIMTEKAKRDEIMNRAKRIEIEKERSNK